MTSQPEKSKSLKIVTRPNVDAGVIKVGTKEVNIDNDYGLTECLSPTTPSSSFSSSLIKIEHEGIINCILLSHWDNILGPRIAHLWTIPDKPHYSQLVLNKVCSQALSGEICRECDNCFIDYKFYTNSEESVLIPSFIFTANSMTGPAVHSISLLIDKSHMSFYLNIQHLVIRCLERLISKLRILLHKVILLLYMSFCTIYFCAFNGIM